MNPTIHVTKTSLHYIKRYINEHNTDQFNSMISLATRLGYLKSQHFSNYLNSTGKGIFQKLETHAKSFIYFRYSSKVLTGRPNIDAARNATTLKNAKTEVSVVVG